MTKPTQVMRPNTSQRWGGYKPQTLTSIDLDYRHGSSTKRGKPEPIFTKGDIDTSVVYVSPEAHNTMVAYVGYCNYEIGWYGTVDVLADGKLLVDAVYLFPQEVSAATTETSGQDQNKFIMKLFEKYDTEKAGDIINRLRLWGHSHVNMATNPSGTDDNQMINFADNLINSDTPFMIRLIMNKRGDVRYDIYDYAMNIAYMDVPWMLYDDVLNNPEETVIDEIKSMVELRTYRPYNSGYGGYSNGRSYWDGGNSGVMDMRQFFDGDADFPEDDDGERAQAQYLLSGTGLDDQGVEDFEDHLRSGVPFDDDDILGTSEWQRQMEEQD